jgi:hypothetical protein
MQPEYLTINQILTSNDKYTIPIYQRNYAWEESQISQLIQDVYDVHEDGNTYYLGSLIVYKRDDLYETIDGQQRLTTLNILASVLKNTNIDIDFIKDIDLNLQFDSREQSNNTVNYFNEFGNKSTSIKLHPQMEQAYEIITRKLNELFGKKLKNKQDLKTFLKYFFENVKILRIEVPKKTDLNHYFEVMNNRGEQLEKHEVLKADFLNILSKEENSDLNRKTFNLIWNACSYMDRYVQYVYKKEFRAPLFGKEWDQLIPDDFQEVSNLSFKNNIQTDNLEEEKDNSLKGIVKQSEIISNVDNDINEEGIERFTPVTSFPHFLLQVLRVTVSSDVQLDDKKLIKEFKDHIFDKDNAFELVKKFGFDLLKTKFLFDNFIVKRDFNNNKEGWAILNLKKQSGWDIGYYTNSFDDSAEQTKLVHLQSMFHVSFPQTNYKHWLSACLNYLVTIDKVEVLSFNNYLEGLSDAFYFNRLKGKLDYRKVIFENNGRSSEENPSLEEINLHLNDGTNVNNFVFNRLDYLLIQDIDNQKGKITEDERDIEYYDFNPNTFEFSFRSSVEHYAPQHPKKEEKPIDNVDNFGNLCLISGSKNSELSNYSPTAKKEHYKKSVAAESLKQRLMMCYKNWDEKTVDEHQSHMIALLNKKAESISVQKSVLATKINTQWSFWESLKKKLENNNLELIEDKSVTKENVAKYYLENQSGNILNGLWSKIEIKNEVLKENNLTIHFGVEVDHKVYFGFTLEENENIGISNNQKFNKYIELVNSINKNYTNNKYWLGWRYTQEDLNFKNPSPEIISNLADTEKLDQTTDKIVVDILNDINQLKTKLENI